MTNLRFYLDENVPVQIARQLKARNIEAVTARELNLLGEIDPKHLQNATQMGFVFCTFDNDFLILAASGISHSGIVFGQQNTHHIGEWVNYLTLMHAVYQSEDMLNRIEFL